MLSRIRGRLNATRFEFTVHVHVLQPWPAGDRAIAIGWQRGKRRRGATKSLVPQPAPGKLGNVVRFNEHFNLPATLYKADTGSATSPLGPFKKKCLILAVLETDGRTNATAALGRIVIDLSEYASIDGQELRTFHVSCNKAIHAAVGDPQLTVTIKCRWKKSGAQFTNDEIASMSTDTTGSQMTLNLSSFLRFRYNKSKRNEEQDLRGFSSKDVVSGMAPIPEQQLHHEIANGAGSTMQSLRQANKSANGLTRASPSAKPTQESIPESPEELTAAEAIADVTDSPAMRARDLPSVDAASPSKSINANGHSDADSSQPRRWHVESNEAKQGRFPRVDFSSLDSDQVTKVLKAELINVAATEVSIYLGPLLAAKETPRGIHAPARRLARTMVSLDKDESLGFGRFAVGLLEHHVKACGEDINSLAFWWTNCVHLRGLIQSSSSMEQYAPKDLLALVPTLLQTEVLVYEEVVDHVWNKVVLPIVLTPPARSVVKTPSAKRAIQEAAVKRWLEAFELANSKLTRMGTRGHIPLLKFQVLLQCLRRADALLFGHLIGSDNMVDVLDPYDPDNTLWGGPGLLPPTLEDHSLPFARGTLTFGVGMNVKMTVARLQNWAFGEGVLRDYWVTLPENSLFILTRSAADLLMMPKELLSDKVIRQDVCSGLALKSMVYVLEKFSTDEFAHDLIKPEIIQGLKDEQATEGEQDKSHALPVYSSPSPEVLTEKVARQQEPGLDYDADSEDELDQISQLSATEVPTSKTLRFQLLDALWKANVPWKRGSVLQG